MTNDEAKVLFEKAGGLLSGHFQLSSGLHSGTYLEKFRLLQNPRFGEPMCKALAERFRNSGAQVVLGPTTVGIILAFEVARHLGLEARFAEREDGRMTLRRGQELNPGTRVLVVDDILTTGGAVKECLDVVARHNAELVGVGVLGDRSGGKVDLGTRVEALLTIEVPNYSPESCPLCADGIPLHKPGTRKIQP